MRFFLNCALACAPIAFSSLAIAQTELPALPPPSATPAAAPASGAPAQPAPEATPAEVQTPAAPRAIAPAPPIYPLPEYPELSAGNRVGEARFTDANSDRVILGSTAETHPAGTFFFSDYEIIFLQFGYAFTDSFQMGLTTLPPFVKDQPYFFDLSAKLTLLRTDVFRLAALGSVDLAFAPKTSDSGQGGRVGGVGQFCFEELCRSSLSLGANAFWGSGASRVPVLLTGGLTLRASSLVSFLVEGLALTNPGASDRDSAFFTVNYGLRLHGKNWGVDLTFVRPTQDDTGLVLGVPWISFTYRTDGSARTATAPPPAY